MPASLRLLELPPSPNNIKVRIALGYKGLAFERETVDPGDRSRVIEASGQPLTPVLLHGDHSLFDSGAILRYLDANFRDTPALFSTDREEMRAIERWESIARGKLMEPIAMVFAQAFAAEADASQLEAACQLLHERSAPIEEQLSQGPWLVGDRMTAADITAAATVLYATRRPGSGGGQPLVEFLLQNLQIGDSREQTCQWVERVMEHDC